uniref:CCCTC-binding factor n=1 Tax=Cacopsylla melanoneura TaxID=428564 RepID=A0A8D8S8D3_9HEMI
MADPDEGNVTTLIKVEALSEVSGEKESVTEIQNYLDTFNKEIEGGVDPSQHTVTEATQYYVDESGQYYFHNTEANGSGHIMTVVQSIDPQADTVDESGEYMQVDELVDDKKTMDLDGQHHQQQLIDLNSGEYQTVTIVPSEGSAGEVSYVLIVQQNEAGAPSAAQTGTVTEQVLGEVSDSTDCDVVELKPKPSFLAQQARPKLAPKKRSKPVEEEDLTVYDFEDVDPIGDDTASVIAEDSVGVESEPRKTVKVIKKQTVAPAHMCNYCNYTSPKRYLLARHMKSHSEERPHKCSVCERGFKTVASLQNHINTHTGVKPHKCKFCESRFTTSGELVRHIRYKHTHEKPHKCTICDYASVELSKMRNHMRSHTGERPYQCPHCTYASPDTFKLKRHLRIHTGEKPYACDICHARFTQSNSLKSHRLIHTGDKPVFYCDLCPATCGRKTDLRIHVQKLHTAEAPLKCKRCGKTFPDRYSFKIHCKSHEGEKCWRCELCPYASSSQRHLESHMLIHTDQKPYLCDNCDQTFRQKQLLKRHVNLYHNPQYVPPSPREKTHKCPECKKAFRHKGNLLRHMTLHDPDSGLQEQQVALKLGRQKKVHIIDGHKVEVIPDDEEDEGEESEEEEGEEGGGEDDDGHQYVVLEVIQVQSEDGTQQNVAVVPASSLMNMGAQGMTLNHRTETVVESIGIDEEDYEGEEEVEEIHETGVEEEEEGGEEALEEKHIITKYERIEEAGMDNCFGFDEEDEEEEEEGEENNVKPVILGT